jgi:hypothetical protein
VNLNVVAKGAEAVELPRDGSAEFKAEVQRVQQELVAKFAWTAQHDGVVYRHDPASLRPLDDSTFNRVSRAGHAFFYLDKSGKRRCFYYRLQEIVSALDDPDLDFGFTFAEAVEFLPGQAPVTKDELNRTVLNLWRAPEWKLDPASPEPTIFLDHVRYLLDGDRGAIDHVLDFIAHLVQRPEQRINHALLLTSEAKGIGKSTLGLIIRRLVDEKNSGVAQSKDLKSQFDGWLMGKVAIQVDEVYEYGNWDLANKLKPLITEPTVSVNMKYGPQMIVRNCARFIMFSNHAAPVDLEDGDRRYFVFDSKAQPRDAGYYEALNAYLDSHAGMNEIFSWLMRRDLTAFKPFAPPPMTEAKRKIIEASGNPLRRYVRDAVESGHFYNTLGAEFTRDELERQLVKDGYGAQSKNTKELKAAIEEAGVTKIRKNVGGQRRHIYRLPNADVLLAEVELAEF